MPIYFWNDPGGARYRESYFEMFPGIWRHGDWIEITERGTAIIHGRSDSTINRGGIRMGTAEIYRAVLSLEEIVDALVVDLPNPDGTDGWMPLFVVLARGRRARRRPDQGARPPRPRALQPAPRPRRGPRDRRGPPHALRQGARGAGEADPDGRRPAERRRAATRSPTPRRSTTSSRWRRGSPRSPRPGRVDFVNQRLTNSTRHSPRRRRCRRRSPGSARPTPSRPARGRRSDLSGALLPVDGGY